jgi:2-desacetyl-2-hydroxyethyl bacteriochlorophyllide A dehydrogenase
LKAVVAREGAPAVVDCPAPEPAGEAVVRVLLAGICGTDLEIVRGYMDHRGVLGHEFVGVVEAAPDGEWIGRRVAGEINVPCRACPTCASGLTRHCPARTVLGILGRDGAFAERVALPLANLHAVPDAVPDEAAVFTEPLAAAHEILDQVAVAPGSRVLVVGDGRLGQLCAHVLDRAGAQPVVWGRHPEKLARLARLGYRTLAGEERPDGRFDVVIEASGSPSGLERALGAVRPRGTVVLKSTYHGGASLSLTGIVVDEVTLVGSRCGSFAPALAHLASDPSLVAGLVTARYPLAEAAAAFARASERDALKVLLAP